MTDFTVVRPNVYTTGAVIFASKHTANETTLYTGYNASLHATTGHTHSTTAGDGGPLAAPGTSSTTFSLSNAAASKLTLAHTALTATRTATFPDVSGTVLLANASTGILTTPVYPLIIQVSAGGGAATDASTVLKLERAGNTSLEFESGATDTQGLIFSDGTGSRGLLAYAHNGDFMSLYTAASERVRVTSGGILAVGNDATLSTGTGATEYLKTGSTSAGVTAVHTIIGSRSGADNYIGAVEFANAALGVAEKRLGTIGVFRNGADNSGGLALWTMNAGTLAERVRVSPAGILAVGNDAALSTGTGGTEFLKTGSTTASTIAVHSIIGSRTGGDDFVGTVEFVNGVLGVAEKRLGLVGLLRSGADNSGAMVLYTMNAGTLAERVRVSPAGNVGIGTASPDTFLHVFAGTGAGAATNADTILKIERNSTIYLEMETSATGNAGLLFSDGTGGRGYLYYAHATDAMILGTSGADRLTIDANGITTLLISAGGGAATNADTMFKIERGSTAYLEFETSTTGNAGLLFSDDGAGRGYVYYAHATDALIMGTAGADRLTLNSSGEMLLPAVDPPTANYGNRNSFLKAWASVSNLGSSSNNYNFSSAAKNATGDLTITWDTDFATGGDQIALATAGDTASARFSNIVSRAAGTVNIKTYDDAGGAADTDIKCMATGTQ